MSQDAFITAIMDRPALWQSKHPNYKKKVNVQLWGEIKELFPENEVSELRKRWKNLKDAYRKEVKKRSGDSAFDSQWQYFEILSFLRDETVLSAPIESNHTETLNAEDERNSIIIDVDDIASPLDAPSPASAHSPNTTQNSQNGPSKKHHTPNELRSEYLKIEKRKLELLEREISQKGSSSSEKSGDYHYLMSILPEMEKLPPLQKMRLRNTINQALMDEMNLSLYGE